MSSTISDSVPSETFLAGDTIQRTKILEGLGIRVINLTYAISKSARYLPIFGRTIGCFEDRLSSLLNPAISNIEKDGLCLLSLVDKKIYAVSDLAMAHVPLASKVIPPLQTLLSGQPLDYVASLLERVQTRGFVGSTADVWVEYEAVVKNKSKSVYNAAHNVPGLKVVVLILKDLSMPVVTLASDWLVTHAEIKDKHEIFLTKDISTSPSASSGKDSTTDDHLIVGYMPDEQRVDAISIVANDRAYIPESAETPAIEKGDTAEDLLNDEKSSVGKDGKGEFPELSVTHEDDEEQDDLSDLFDTWGLGVKAISSDGLESLRSISLGRATGSGKT